MPDNVFEKELLFRHLAGNPTARKVAERALALEDEANAQEASGKREYPWNGFEWFDVSTPAQTLNTLVVDELLVTGGARGTFKSNSSQTFKLRDPEMVREVLQELQTISQGEEDTEIPKDLFDFIIGQDKVKDLFMRSLSSERPVHILLVGPPATSKTMFLGELARLPFSRYAIGGSTRRGGLEDYLLEFRPRFLIIDEIDKMDMRDMSVLLSLMESGVVARLKKRMREVEKMTTWVFAGANRDERIWPELKSRFFTVRLSEYSQADFMHIVQSVLEMREKVEPGLARVIATNLAQHTRDVREAVHFARLCRDEHDVEDLVKMKWPGSRLF